MVITLKMNNFVLMKDSIQNKIDHIKAIAAASSAKAISITMVNNDRTGKTDSLSNAIRNEKEAAVFYAEMKAAVLLAKSK